MFLAVAFMVSGWAAIAAATTDCTGCPGQMQGMGDMGGKEKPSDNCMLKITCSAINAQLPVPISTGAAIALIPARYPAAAPDAYRSHHIAPPLIPPRLFA